MTFRRGWEKKKNVMKGGGPPGEKKRGRLVLLSSQLRAWELGGRLCGSGKEKIFRRKREDPGGDHQQRRQKGLDLKKKS